MPHRIFRRIRTAQFVREKWKISLPEAAWQFLPRVEDAKESVRCTPDYDHTGKEKILWHDDIGKRKN